MPSPWYKDREGQSLVLVYIMFVVLATYVSMGEMEAGLWFAPVLETVFGGVPVLAAVPDLLVGLLNSLDLPGEVQPIRPIFYVAGAVGVVLWGLRAIIHRGDQGIHGADEESGEQGQPSGTLFTGEPLELLFRPFAVFPLVAGVVLLSGSFAGGSAEAATSEAVALALFVGVFLDRVYERLGRIADSLRRTDTEDSNSNTENSKTGDSNSDTEDSNSNTGDSKTGTANPKTGDSKTGDANSNKGDSNTEDSNSLGLDWWTSRHHGGAVVAIYFVAGLPLLAVTAEHSPLAYQYEALSLPVPLGVYFYAFIGAMGRIFTGILRDDQLPTAKLKAWGARIPFAMLMAAAVYLVLQVPLEPFSSSYHISGVAFLVGLYEGVGLHFLARAERLLPTAEEAGGGEDEESQTGGGEDEESEADGGGDEESEADGGGDEESEAAEG